MMDFTEQEVRQYVEQEDVRFIRLAFCDVFGKQKNIAILPTSADLNLFTASEKTLQSFERLPTSLKEANALALHSDFVRRTVPEAIIAAYCER